MPDENYRENLPAKQKIKQIVESRSRFQTANIETCAKVQFYCHWYDVRLVKSF